MDDDEYETPDGIDIVPITSATFVTAAGTSSDSGSVYSDFQLSRSPSPIRSDSESSAPLSYHCRARARAADAGTASGWSFAFSDEVGPGARERGRARPRPSHNDDVEVEKSYNEGSIETDLSSENSHAPSILSYDPSRDAEVMLREENGRVFNAQNETYYYPAGLLFPSLLCEISY
jgi:hypothetical protein